MAVSSLKEVLVELRSQRETQTHILRVLERQQASLDEHVRRTEAAEKAIDIVRTELSPLKVHAAVWGAASKVLVGTAALVSVVLGALKITALF